MTQTDAAVEAGVARGELTFRQLTHFAVAAEEGSISGAARRLQFSPSAISASITELERALGAELCVRRRAQGVTLTPTGRLVPARARKLLADVAELTYTARGSESELVGPLIVGCFGTLAPTVLPRLLHEFGALHPRVSIDFVVVSQNELAAELRTGGIDVAIMHDMGGLQGLNWFPLYESRGTLLLGEMHPLATREQVTLEELVEFPFVLFNHRPSTPYAIAMFEERGVAPWVRHRTYDFELTRSIVARSDTAYTVLVQRPANKASYEGLPVIEKEIFPPAKTVATVFAWSQNVDLSPRAIALSDLVRTHYPQPTHSL